MPTLELPDGTVAYEQLQGTSSQPVIALHGLGDSSIHTLMPVFGLEPLQGTSALFIDVPGFGASPAGSSPATIEDHADIVAAFLQGLGLNNVPVFGHSMGANISILLAARYPELVSELILAEPLLRSNHSVLAAQINRFTESSYEERGHRMLLRATSQQAFRGDVAAVAFLSTLRMADARVMYRSAVSLLANREPGFQEIVRGLKQPATLIVGERSGGKHLDTVDIDGTILIVENAGHSMHTEQPVATAAAIQRALDHGSKNRAGADH